MVMAVLAKPGLSVCAFIMLSLSAFSVYIKKLAAAQVCAFARQAPIILHLEHRLLAPLPSFRDCLGNRAVRGAHAAG